MEIPPYEKEHYFLQCIRYFHISTIFINITTLITFIHIFNNKHTLKIVKILAEGAHKKVSLKTFIILWKCKTSLQMKYPQNAIIYNCWISPKDQLDQSFKLLQMLQVWRTDKEWASKDVRKGLWKVFGHKDDPSPKKGHRIWAEYFVSLM